MHCSPAWESGKRNIFGRSVGAAHHVEIRLAWSVSSPSKFSGGHGGGAIPDPIPNSEVKPSCADGTAGATLWESRSLPDLCPWTERSGGFFFGFWEWSGVVLFGLGRFGGDTAACFGGCLPILCALADEHRG